MIAKLLQEPPDQEVNKTEEIKENGEAMEQQDEIKNPNRLLSIYHTRIELYYMQQRMEVSGQLYEQALETAEKLIGF